MILKKTQCTDTMNEALFRMGEDEVTVLKIKINIFHSLLENGIFL